MQLPPAIHLSWDAEGIDILKAMWKKVALFSFALSIAAQTNPIPGGEWVLNLGPRTLMIVSLVPPVTPGDVVSGSITMPDQFQTSDGWSFSHIQGGSSTKPIVASSWKSNAISFTVRDSADASDTDTVLFTMKDPSHAQIQLEGTPMPPFELVRTDAKATVATDWDVAKTYSPDDGFSSNPEMKRIFDEDQKVRQQGTKIDWAVVGKSDAARREATRKLLNESALHSGEDYTWAAFVFQHGSTPDDYLLAHTLALVALRKGYGDAVWIATATLDRYLDSIEKPQIYGTQFHNPQGQDWTQEPYDRGLISDVLRRELGVPVQSAQEAQLKQFAAPAAAK
jgi:hypothetical protein